MVEVSGLSKRFGARWIFRNLDFKLGKGDSLVVLGRNGSGKSTLLKIISGLLPPSSGTVTLPDDVRKCLGYSALEQSLYPSLTCAEHLEFTAAMRGCPPRTAELLEQIGLQDAADRQANEISTGMKSRLRVAIAIQNRPQILLLDEPGAALDEAGRALIRLVSNEQRERGCLILATNDPGERSLANLELRLED